MVPGMRKTILQPGATCSDLIVYAHIDGDVLRPVVPAITDDAFVTLFAGTGTSAYKGIVANAGGWGGFVQGLEAELGHTVLRTLLITWSAGSQVAMEACASEAPPDAVVMLDGLYASKPPKSAMGDGQVINSPGLNAVVSYAIRAAKREPTANGERVMVIFHSRIPTTYASSKECAEFVQQRVEEAMGEKMLPATDVTADTLDGHFFTEALAIGNLRIVEFAGANAGEHIREAHLWDEAIKLWVPWVTGRTVCDPDTGPRWALRRVLRNTFPMMRGEDVRAWQAFLSSQGANVQVDGIFGPKTKLATETWQRAYVLPVTGQLDAVTYGTAIGNGFIIGTPPAPAPFVPEAEEDTQDAAPSTSPTGETVVPPRPNIVLAVLERAANDLGMGEDLGKNDGTRIREMLRPFGIVPPANWCAVAFADWLRNGARDAGVSPPISGSSGAIATMGQFRSANRWVSIADVRKNPALIRPGMVPVWDRSVPGNPASSWWGHIGVTISTVNSAGYFTTIEGNSGTNADRCAKMSRSINDPKLFGFGWID